MKYYKTVITGLSCLLILLASCEKNEETGFNMDNLYPWCIVAFDSLERSPTDRIQMMNELGFTKYAYDWRDHHLDDSETELRLAQENNIEVISVWLWLNAKRDSVGTLSPGNERMFQIVKNMELETTFWVSFSENFFKDKSQEESKMIAVEMIEYIKERADAMNCNIALYNHRGWFGNPHNQVEIIESLPDLNLSIVYNFHHAHSYSDEFPEIVNIIRPYLSWVNINGMQVDGPKIMPVGSGDLESEMIKILVEAGFRGPWGILGHVENRDVREVLEENIEGLNKILPSIYGQGH